MHIFPKTAERKMRGLPPARVLYCGYRALPYVAQVQCEDAQAGPAGELVVTRQNGANLLFCFTRNRLIFCHEALHLPGCVILNGDFVVIYSSITLYAIR